jgi:hypothetical protein
MNRPPSAMEHARRFASGALSLVLAAVATASCAQTGDATLTPQCAVAWKYVGAAQRKAEGARSFAERCRAAHFAARCGDGYVDVRNDAHELCRGHGPIKGYVMFPDG